MSKNEGINKNKIMERKCIETLQTSKPIPLYIIKQFLKSQDSFIIDTVECTPDGLRKSFWETISGFIDSLEGY